MIKAALLGADSPLAGELLRILVRHPEVDIVGAYAPELTGTPVASLHKGLIGDTDLKFSNLVDLADLDVLFVTDSKQYLDSAVALPEELKIVYIQGNEQFTVPAPFNLLDFVPGVSEMYRKPLVRGARASRILSPATSVALIALFPLALHLLLNDSLTIDVELPENILNSSSPQGIADELEKQLKQVQLSLNKIGIPTIKGNDARRGLEVTLEFDCSVSVDEIRKIYNEVYDDHNFTFIVDSKPSLTEVAATHKCLLYVDKPADNKVRITAIADGLLRGGAGDAIHAMNLLFGLFEKIGLSFPASLAYVGK